MTANFQTTFSKKISWMKIYIFRFHWRLFPRVQLTIFQHWFRQWLGAGGATSHYLNQWCFRYFWRIYFASLGLNDLIHWCQCQILRREFRIVSWNLIISGFVIVFIFHISWNLLYRLSVRFDVCLNFMSLISKLQRYLKQDTKSLSQRAFDSVTCNISAILHASMRWGGISLLWNVIQECSLHDVATSQHINNRCHEYRQTNLWIVPCNCITGTR